MEWMQAEAHAVGVPTSVVRLHAEQHVLIVPTVKKQLAFPNKELVRGILGRNSKVL